ncbi:MAG: hypothetical protein AB8I08_17780 [Sandaracinaceae bacterium]
MRTDGHISIARTRVRAGELSRHVARRFDHGRAYAVSSGIGLPRTWGLSTVVAIEGFERGLAGATGDPASRLRTAFSEARDALADACDNLVERLLPDATLVGMVIDDGHLHVMSVGAGRVYIQRGGRPQRLTAREEENGGLLRSRPSICSTPVEPGDLVLAGSVTAFSMSSIARVVSVINSDPMTQASVLAKLLTDPAGKAGVGAAAVATRVR